jgi:ribosome-associated translation inhibitor RaiA
MTTMQIDVTTDNHVEGGEALVDHVQTVVKNSLARFGNRVTWVEVHLGNENSRKSGGAWCGIHAKLAGLNTMNVDARADYLHVAIDAAANKLLHAIDHAIGKKEISKKRTSQTIEIEV